MDLFFQNIYSKRKLIFQKIKENYKKWREFLKFNLQKFIPLPSMKQFLAKFVAFHVYYWPKGKLLPFLPPGFFGKEN